MGASIRGHAMTDEPFTSARQEHREALRLSRSSCHIPLGTILLACLALASLLSTVITILAQSPANAMQ
jgi:hypothetical protein